MSHLVTASVGTRPWAGLVPAREDKTYRMLGYLPSEAGSLAAELHDASGSSPIKAYEKLVRKTKRIWCLGLREADLIDLDQESWKNIIRRVPEIRMVSESLWGWAEPIWKAAWDDPPESLYRSQALWLALTAGHDNRSQRKEDIPF